MSPQHPWPYQVPLAFVDTSGTVPATGEESFERKVMTERAYRLNPVLYPTPLHVPPTPAEPLNPDPEQDYRQVSSQGQDIAMIWNLHLPVNMFLPSICDLSISMHPFILVKYSRIHTTT